ncbi:Alpha/Beta hydrolase protein [Gigaspora rosea]|uniref:Alpha/Beta hydrolase protein n=1 Tax=Gigaspora rosea TaxID=44941 RepID=A0A397W5S8_9GLOM|nr:Alpha/Beta hydrolase protein [Gigaspora rosea]
MAEDTIALIRHLKIKRFNLLGWSMGGRIAVYFASNPPQDIELEKLIICSRFQKIFKNKKIILEKHLKKVLLKRQWEAIKEAEILSKLQKITVPTLIIHGKTDGAVSIK